MHDLDRTTMEISDEAETSKSPEQYEYASQGESPFNEDEVEPSLPRICSKSPTSRSSTNSWASLLKKSERVRRSAL